MHIHICMMKAMKRTRELKPVCWQHFNFWLTVWYGREISWPSMDGDWYGYVNLFPHDKQQVLKPSCKEDTHVKFMNQSFNQKVRKCITIRCDKHQRSSSSHLTAIDKIEGGRFLERMLITRWWYWSSSWLLVESCWHHIIYMYVIYHLSFSIVYHLSLYILPFNVYQIFFFFITTSRLVTPAFNACPCRWTSTPAWKL